MPSITSTRNIYLKAPTDAKASAKKLDCSVAELRIALRAVGSPVARVQAYLDALNGRESLSKAAPVQAEHTDIPTPAAPASCWPSPNAPPAGGRQDL
jgi:hypothetical protein